MPFLDQVQLQLPHSRFQRFAHGSSSQSSESVLEHGGKLLLILPALHTDGGPGIRSPPLGARSAQGHPPDPHRLAIATILPPPGPPAHPCLNNTANIRAAQAGQRRLSRIPASRAWLPRLATELERTLLRRVCEQIARSPSKARPKIPATPEKIPHFLLDWYTSCAEDVRHCPLLHLPHSPTGPTWRLDDEFSSSGSATC